jgi:hypothetical protein
MNPPAAWWQTGRARVRPGCQRLPTLPTLRPMVLMLCRQRVFLCLHAGGYGMGMLVCSCLSGCSHVVTPAVHMELDYVISCCV